MPPPTGFEWSRRGNGDVVISHHGQVVTTLRGQTAETFATKAAEGDEQALMARATANYKRGNERSSRQHPRQRGRR